jgi:hypothetical protein
MRITDRREEELQRCPAGFTRVEGACDRILPAVTQTGPVTAAPSAHDEEAAAKKKHNRAAVGHRREAVSPPRVAVTECSQPLTDEPLPVEPPIRFASWTHLYGDYEKRDASGSALSAGNAFGNVAVDPLGLPMSVRTRSGTIGFMFGGNATLRGLLTPQDGLIAGLLLGYANCRGCVFTQRKARQRKPHLPRGLELKSKAS